MAKRHFNWTVAIVLAGAMIILTATAFSLRKWQRNRLAYAGREIGLKAYENSDWEEAAKNLGRYIAVEQTNAEIMLKYADAQLNIRPLKSSNIKQAIATYRTILRVDQGNSAAVNKLVSLYLQMNIPAEAELITQRYLQINEDPNIRRMLAISLAEQRKYKEAVAQLHSIIEKYPEQVPAYETLGLITEHYPEEFPGKLTHWFNEAVINNPLSAQAFIARAAFRLRNNEATKAIVDLEEAEKLDLSEPTIRLRLAREFANAGMFEKARTHLKAVYTQDPANQVLWQTWANIALKAGLKEEMLEVALTGLKELSSNPWDFMSVAVELFVHSGDLDHARGCLGELKQKGVISNRMLFLEGLLAEVDGQNHKAILSWRKALQSGDKSPRTQLALAVALVLSGDIQSAIKQLRTLVVEQPNLLKGHLELAKLLSQTGSWVETREQARLAMQIAPENIDAVLLHIRAQLRLVKLNENNAEAKELTWQRIEKQLAELDNRTKGNLQVKLLQFQLAMQRGQLTKAQKILANLKTDEKPQFSIAKTEVDLLIAQDNVDEAIVKLYTLNKQFPQNSIPAKYLSALLAKYRDRTECEKVLTDAISRIKSTAAKRELGILLAAFYGQWEQKERAHQLLTELSEELLYDIPIKRQLLKYKHMTGNLNGVQKIINDIKANEGESGWQWRYEQANLWFAEKSFKNQYPKIVALLQENLTANPTDQTSRLLLATTYEKAGELQLAVRTYKEALNNSPEDIRIIVPAIAAMYKIKEYEQADEILNRVARQKMMHPELAKLELHSHLRHGELSSAEEILEDLMAKEPDNHTIPLSLALLKMRQDKYDQADELLNRLKAQEPNSLPVIAALVELKVNQGKNDEALALCDETVNQLGNASAYILRGKTYVMLGRDEPAKKDFDQATDIEPDNIQAWLFKSDFNRLAGRLEEAFDNIQKSLMLNPENLQIQKRAIELLLFSGEADKTRQGMELLDKALSLNPQDVELRFYKASFLLTKGTAPAIEQAQNILQKITEEQPRIPNAWALKAQIHLKQAQLGKAIETVLSGLAYSPSNKTLLSLKAQAESDRSPTLAIPTLKMLAELYPDDMNIKLNLANTYIAAGQNDEAIAYSEKLLPNCKQSDQRKFNIALATATYKKGNKTEAQKKFEFLYQSAPDDPAPLLAEILLLKNDKLWSQVNQKAIGWIQNHPTDIRTPILVAGDLALVDNNHAQNTAEEILRTVLKNNPDAPEVMTSLAMLLQMTENTEESAKIYEQILILQPDNVIAINNLAWIRCEEQGKYQQAVELAQQGLEKAPDYIDLINTRGVAYYRTGEFNKAVLDLTYCTKLYPARTPSAVASYFHLARALAGLGQKDDALENLKKALELDAEIGGLSKTDSAEAQYLLEELLRGV